MDSRIVTLVPPGPSLLPTLKLAAIRSIAAGHAFGSETNLTRMRAALKRICAICDGEESL